MFYRINGSDHNFEPEMWTEFENMEELGHIHNKKGKEKDA